MCQGFKGNLTTPCVKFLLCCIACCIQKETNKTSKDMIWHVVQPEIVCLFHSQRVICPRYFSSYHHLHSRLIQLTWLLIQTMWWFTWQVKLCNLPHASDCMKVCRNNSMHHSLPSEWHMENIRQFLHDNFGHLKSISNDSQVCWLKHPPYQTGDWMSFEDHT